MSKSRYANAVGLRYDASQQSAPAVTINAAGSEADLVVKLAYRFGTPVIDDPDLADLLKKLELDQDIPANLYRAVAVIFSQLQKV